MLIFTTKNGWKNPVIIDSYVLHMVKDLEETQWKYHGYAYVRTMRNIFIGKENAVIAPYFTEKDYYGLFDELSLEELERILDTLVSVRKLYYVFTEHGKLYCTKEYYDQI